jgi:uncharacterized protein YdaT
MDEGIAIAIAISRAKDWAENRGKEIEAPASSRTKKRKVELLNLNKKTLYKESYAVNPEERITRIFNRCQTLLKCLTPFPALSCAV